MTRITGADQILTILRAQLERREKQRRKTTTGASAQRDKLDRSSVERLRAIASESDLPRAAIERILVQALLVEEFGEAAVNDAQFQKMLEAVQERIARDEQAKVMLQRAVDELLAAQD